MEEEGLRAPACWDRSQRALCSLGDGLVPRLGVAAWGCQLLSAAPCWCVEGRVGQGLGWRGRGGQVRRWGLEMRQLGACGGGGGRQRAGPTGVTCNLLLLSFPGALVTPPLLCPLMFSCRVRGSSSVPQDAST